MASTQRFDLGTSTNQPVALVLETQGALVTTSTREALNGSVAAIARGKRELATLMRGKAGELDKTLLQRASTALVKGEVNTWPAMGVGTFLGVIGGFCLGAVAGMVADKGAVFLATWAGTTAVGVAVVPVCAAVVAAAGMHKRIVKRRMVELPDLRPPLERFRSTEGAQKVQLGIELVKLRDALETQRILSPEARTALQDAAAEAEALPQELRAMAGRLATLAKAVAGPMSASVVDTIEAELDAAQPAERMELATALRELLFADRKQLGSLDYDLRNRLHTVLSSAEKPTVGNQ